MFFIGGRRVRLVALTALTTLAVGGAVYYPRGYVGLARPMCTGQTDEGCSLAWRDVPTEEGTVVPQCVQFCPQAVQPQAVSVAQTPPTPVKNAGGCEVRAFTEANLKGETFTTGDSYPDMGDWAQQVVSLQITAGTWDFYAEDNYGGEAVRFGPGDYPTLPEGWANQISSFMCVQPDGQ